jgi:hypothetical protein
MRYFKVTVTEVVYVEDGNADNVEAIAIEHLDEYLPHEYSIRVDEVRPDDVNSTALAVGLRPGGWARDNRKETHHDHP